MIRILESSDEVYSKEYTETRRHIMALISHNIRPSALCLLRCNCCSVSKEALCTAMSFNCTPYNRELENMPQYLATQLIHSKVL